MNTNNVLKQTTLMINTCDSYSDLWEPFFTLLARYWKNLDIEIILNTETKTFSFDGLNINCVNCDSCQYGERMINALSNVKTEYVIMFLDDFFLRSPVNDALLETVIRYMNADSDIVCFNSECMDIYAETEVDKYPGFVRVPTGNPYTLNMQAAIWRTQKLRRYWERNVSPWEWEVYGNYKTYLNSKDKFYCSSKKNELFDYGHYAIGDVWGVYRSKWVIEDVKPLFEKEGISIDYSIRGIYHQNDEDVAFSNLAKESKDKIIERTLGKKYYYYYRFFCFENRIKRKLKIECNDDFYALLERKGRKRFMCKKKK